MNLSNSATGFYFTVADFFFKADYNLPDF